MANAHLPPFDHTDDQVQSTPEGEQAVRISNLEDAEERLMGLVEVYTTDENMGCMKMARTHLKMGFLLAYAAILNPTTRKDCNEDFIALFDQLYEEDDNVPQSHGDLISALDIFDEQLGNTAESPQSGTGTIPKPES